MPEVLLQLQVRREELTVTTHLSERSPDGSHDDLKVYGQYLETVSELEQEVSTE